MRADLAARLAHQLAGLHPLTSAPLRGDQGGAASAGGDSSSSSSRPALEAAPAAALEAAQLVVASLPEGCASSTADCAGSDKVADLASQLAFFAQQAYQAAEQALGELRCAAVLGALGGRHSVPADALQRGLYLAHLLLRRFGLAARMQGVKGWGRRPNAEESAALRQLEQLFNLSGLSDPAATAAHGGGVCCPRSDPGLRALADLYADAAGTLHEGGERMILERRRLARQPGSGLGPAELLVAQPLEVQVAAAFYLMHLARAAGQTCLTVPAARQLEPPPGLAAAVPGATSQAALAKQLGALGARLQAIEQQRRVLVEAWGVFRADQRGGFKPYATEKRSKKAPVLQQQKRQQAEADAALRDGEQACLGAALAAAFPPGESCGCGRERGKAALPRVPARRRF